MICVYVSQLKKTIKLQYVTSDFITATGSRFKYQISISSYELYSDDVSKLHSLELTQRFFAKILHKFKCKVSDVTATSELTNISHLISSCLKCFMLCCNHEE